MNFLYQTACFTIALFGAFSLVQPAGAIIDIVPAIWLMVTGIVLFYAPAMFKRFGWLTTG